jgi:hypothetical protein
MKKKKRKKTKKNIDDPANLSFFIRFSADMHLVGYYVEESKKRMQEERNEKG